MKTPSLEHRIFAQAVERELAAACALAESRKHPGVELVSIRVRLRDGAEEIRVDWPARRLLLPGDVTNHESL